ncbi:MAG: prephenate dehydrogenase [Candidatus Omnitrophota bacterium]
MAWDCDQEVEKMMMKKFNKTVIVGSGLIGGSIGMVLKKKKLSRCVVGVTRHSKSLENAIEKQAIDYGTMDVEEAVLGADLVILATPVRVIEKTILKIKNKLAKGAIVIDVGSTKKEIVDTAQKHLPVNVNFIGTHPMAGSEKLGVVNADIALFKNAICFISKTKRTNKNALSRVKKLWESLGARIVLVDPSDHDRIVAQISHLPHIIAAALVDSTNKVYLKYAASGFKDTTRIASGGPEMWRDISFSNRQAILESIRFFEKELQYMKKALAANNESAFTQLLVKAKKKRDSIG